MPSPTLAVLLEAALKGAAIFVIVTLAMPFLRRRSAAVRHAAWSFAVGAQLVLPALAAVAPAWGTRLADQPQWVADAFTSPAGRAGTATPGTVAAGARDEAAVPPTIEPNERPRNLLGTLTSVWLAGAGLILLHLAVGTVGVWRLAARGSRILDPGWLAMAHQLAARIGISRPLTLLRGESLAVPVTWGIVYPVVLLPTEAESWDAEQRRYVLVHEMAHIRRFDALTHLVGQVTLAIFWFNPLVWLAVSRIRAEREHACDDYVLRTGTRPSRYANDLLTLVRTIGLPDRRSTPPAFAALSMARRSEFEGRMMAILQDDTPRAPLSGRGIAGGAASAAVLALALAGFSPLAPREGAMPAAAPRPVPVPAGASSTARVPSPVTPAPPADGPVDTVPAPVRPRGAGATASGPSPVTSVAQADGGSLDSVLASLRPDGNKAAILAQYARSGDDARLSAAMRAVPSLARDQDKSVVLAHAAPGALGGGDARLRDAFFAALESIRSDDDRALALVHATANAKGSHAVTALVLRATARMQSPGPAATVLMNVAQRHLVTSDSLRVLYVRIADSLASDADRQRSLTALRLATRGQPPASP